MGILIAIPLTIMVVLALVSTLSGLGEFNIGTYDDTTQLTWESMSTSGFYIDPLQGALVMMLIVALFVGIMGIRIFTAGLAETSIKMLSTLFFYLGIWGVFSVLALPLIMSIQLYGLSIYIILTIMYTVGVFEKGRGGGVTA